MCFMIILTVNSHGFPDLEIIILKHFPSFLRQWEPCHEHSVFQTKYISSVSHELFNNSTMNKAHRILTSKNDDQTPLKYLLEHS